ncbi:MAG: response regulator [bacterium]|nr:response regulator [bacterium]
MNTEPKEIELLIVEDDPNDAELLLRVFKQHRLVNKVSLLKDGAEALDFIFARGAYSAKEVNDESKVIILDLKLPKINGIEVLEKLKADERTRKIPVVVLTSSRENKDVKEAYRLGVNSYVTKPIKFDEFAKVVSELGIYWLMLNKLPHR